MQLRGRENYGSEVALKLVSLVFPRHRIDIPVVQLSGCVERGARPLINPFQATDTLEAQDAFAGVIHVPDRGRFEIRMILIEN
jgi:hypothetical protein